jgi:prepilin-type N-terminal cleavage/methylation domain-containing protein
MVSRAGFSLTEVVVAVLLLSIVAVSVAAGGGAAAQMFTRAEMQERVLREAETILDSLLVQRVNANGSRELANATITWTAADSAGTIAMLVQMRDRTLQLTGQR